MLRASMNRFAFVLGAIALVFTAACGRQKEITTLQRKEAANLASEAQFAMSLRDLPRTEGLLKKAAELCPDSGEYWVNLGSVRMHMKDRSGAKTAYKSALSAYQAAYKKDSKDKDLLLRQVYVLALLGDVKEARSVLDDAQKKNPDDRL